MATKLKLKIVILLFIVCFAQVISCFCVPPDIVYTRDQTAGLSKKKLKYLKESLTDIQTLTDYNYKTVDYAEMIFYVMNVEHTEFRDSSYDYEEHLPRIKTKTMDNYLKQKFHLKKPKKKIEYISSSPYSDSYLVFEKKGYYCVQGATGEAARTVKLISVKKLSGKKYEVLYDNFIYNENTDNPVEVYEETVKAVVSYSTELKTWTFYKIKSQGKLTNHPKKSYLKI